MKKLRKIFAAAVATMAIAAMSVIPAFAATIDGFNVEMYGIKDGAYVASPHTEKMVESVADNGDGTYTVVFVPITETYNGVTATGYISSISTIDAVEGVIYTGTYDEDLEITEFTFVPGGVTIDGNVGTKISYTVEPNFGHSTNTGAIVITPASAE